MKLSTLIHTPPAGDHNANSTCIAESPSTEHLLCLNQQEALMLFGLLQAACRHEATRRTLLSSGDYQEFHRQLSQSLAEGLAKPQK